MSFLFDVKKGFSETIPSRKSSFKKFNIFLTSSLVSSSSFPVGLLNLMLLLFSIFSIFSLVRYLKLSFFKITYNFFRWFLLFSTLENTIENSFRKFWSLSERIIKDIHGGMKDEKLVKYMEKLLKMCRYPDKIIQRVKFIKTKRNNLVHENIHGEITQSDQAIVKIIAKNLILFLICYFNEVTDIGDYKSFYDL